MAFTDLHRACQRHDLNYINKIIPKGSSTFNGIKLIDRFLSSACSSGHMDLVQLAMDNGATDYDTGLFYACSNNHFDLVRLMLSKGAGAEINNCLRITNDVTIAKLLMAYGADNYDDLLVEACKKGNVDLVVLAVDRGANNYSLMTNRYDQALKAVCENGNVTIANILISEGAGDLDICFSIACKYNHLDLVKYLLYNGAYDYYDGFRNACQYGHFDLVKFLLTVPNLLKTHTYTRRGVTYTKTDDLYSPFTWACRSGNIDIVRLFFDIGIDIDKVGTIGDVTNLDIIKLLISKGHDEISLDLLPKYSKYLANVLYNNNKFWFLDNILGDDLIHEIKNTNL